MARTVDLERFTCNTCHVVKAVKDALDGINLAPADAEALKEAVSYGNAVSLLGAEAASCETGCTPCLSKRD
jgi:hypothetical protein